MINLAALAIYYAWRAGAMIAVGGLAARPADRALVVANVVWVAAAFSAVAWGLGRWRPAAAALWWALLWWLVIVDCRVFLLLGVHLGRSAPAVAEALPFSELPSLFPPPGGQEVHYPALREAPRVGRPLNVLVLLVESLRADALEAMPHLRQFAASHGNVRSRRHYAGAHSTEYATFSLL